MDKRMINLIIGVVVALFAIMMINNHFQDQQRLMRQLIEQGKYVEVVVAAKDIPRETTITMDMVRLQPAKSQSVQPLDLPSVDSAIGKLAEVDILKGQHINSSMVRALGGIKVLSKIVPPGFRAITVPVNKTASIEGLIRPGDHVDIVSTFNLPNEQGTSEIVVVTMFQGVKILATDKNLSEVREPRPIDTVTIALKPDDIRTLAYILEYSTIRLVLRSPGDMIDEPGYVAVTWEGLLKKLGMLPEPVVQPTEAVIETYHGPKMLDTKIGE